RPLVHRYVAGYTVEEAWKAAEELKRDGIDVSLDLLGESVDDIKETEAAMQEYRAAMEDLGKVSPGATIAIKLSQLGVFITLSNVPRISKSYYEPVNTTMSV